MEIKENGFLSITISVLQEIFILILWYNLCYIIHETVVTLSYNWVWICLYLPNKTSVFDSIFMYLNLQIYLSLAQAIQNGQDFIKLYGS